MAENRHKKRKIDIDPVFKTFDKEFKKKLDVCRVAVLNGTDDMNLSFLKITCANPGTARQFANSTCETIAHTWPNHNSSLPHLVGSEVRCVIGAIFTEGLDILDNYFNRNKIPREHCLQLALAKLLNFFNEDHTPLFEDMTRKSKGEWTVRIAQHLLSKLSVQSTYLMDSYGGCSLEIGSACPCSQQDELCGFTYDTSYGYRNGWHGKADIIMQDIPVIVQTTASPATRDVTSSTEIEAVSLAEIALNEKINSQLKTQLKAQTITFSPWLIQYNGDKLRNSLIPGIAISTKYMLVNFYDPENDILLTSRVLNLIDRKKNKLKYTTVMFLWLTLNYSLFCSGLKESMKRFKAEFFKVIDKDLFMDNIERPYDAESEDEEDEGIDNPGEKWEWEPAISTVSDYVDVDNE